MINNKLIIEIAYGWTMNTEHSHSVYNSVHENLILSRTFEQSHHVTTSWILSIVPIFLCVFRRILVSHTRLIKRTEFKKIQTLIIINNNKNNQWIQLINDYKNNEVTTMGDMQNFLKWHIQQTNSSSQTSRKKGILHIPVCIYLIKYSISSWIGLNLESLVFHTCEAYNAIMCCNNEYPFF